MLNFIIRLALRHRLLVVAITALVTVYGVLALNNLPIDVFPDITKPTVTIMTEAHGMAPEEVESQVTWPIESYLSGLPGLDRVRSQSGIGLSAIYVEFDWGTDIYRNRQLVQEKLNLVRQTLPEHITPIMGPVGSLMGQIQQIAVTSNKLKPMELRDLAEWVIRPRLMTVAGVSQVISLGGGLKQYQILVSAEKLNKYQLSLDKVDKVLSDISQNSTGGFLEKNKQEYLVRNIGVVNTIEDIEDTFVGMHFGNPILIKDIARVVIAPKLKRGDASFNGKPAIVMTIQKQPNADTVDISNNIEKAIEELKPSLPDSVVVNPNVFKQANFIQSSIDGIASKLQIGTVLVLIVLLIFLANLRMSLITLTAIPVSFLVTAIVFKLFGMSVNTMTLGGLAIAIGELVDDSIVDVENIFRRLRENAKLANPLPKLKVIYNASSEIRNSIVLATVIIALVFLPLFNLTGLEGQLFTPLAISYITALLASLLVSLTLTPVLSFYFLKTIKKHDDTQFVKALKNYDYKILNWALPRANKVLVGAAVLIALSACLLPFMGRDFLPKFNEGTAMVAIIAPSGISLSESNSIGAKAVEIMLSIPEVKSVSRRTGRAERDEHAMGVNVSEIDIDFHNQGRPREVVLNEMRDKLKNNIENIGVNIGQPISHLIDHMLSGVSAAMAIKVFGPELHVLKQKALEIESSIKDIKGLVDLRVEDQTLVPQVKNYIYRKDAAKYGLSSGEATELLDMAFNGETVDHVIDGNKMHDVFFRFDESSRSTTEQMKNTVLKIMPDGERVELKDIADVYETSGPNQIYRENNQRRIIVSANVSGRDLGGLITDIKKEISNNVELPQGYYITYGGQFENQQRASKKMLWFSLISLFVIALVLFTHFKSKAIVFQIMVTIPLAFIGGIIFLFLTEKTITVASLVGFITLCGVASRNSIMMISHYLHLMKYEGEAFTKSMIIRGSQERLVPVMMTALVAGLALLPLVFSKGEPGSEILHPVAVVIVGGLFSSTIMDIIVTPTLFYKFGKKSAENYINQKGEKI